MSTKETVLELFEKNRGFFISGEKIASDLNVSRTAVWKAVKKLQKEGYEIEAITNRGYCLAKNSDILSVQGIRNHLGPLCSGLRPDVFITVDSTNSICRQRANLGEEEGYVAIAGGQTNGRGRMGRIFYSPSDTGIYMSILLKPVGFPGKQVLRLTTMAAVAVCEAIESISDNKADIKWVNDIFIDGRKVCGILSEASYSIEDGSLDAVVVGIGINAYTPKDGFPEEIADIAGSVFESACSGKRNHLVAEVLNRFMYYYSGKSTGDHMSEYRKRSIVLGRDIEFTKNGRTYKGHAVDLDEDGCLMIRYEDGREDILNSGEVSILGIES